MAISRMRSDGRNSLRDIIKKTLIAEKHKSAKPILCLNAAVLVLRFPTQSQKYRLVKKVGQQFAYFIRFY